MSDTDRVSLPTRRYYGADVPPSKGPHPDPLAEVDMRRVRWCEEHGIAPFEICADGGCEAWMLVTDQELLEADDRPAMPWEM